MKIKIIIPGSIALISTAFLAVSSTGIKKPIHQTSAITLPTTIDLNSFGETAIRGYYQTLDNLDESERKGTNLLKNLKPILTNNFRYFSYNQIWQIYEITDRNWTLSPANSTTYGTYHSDTNTITNYEYYTKLSEPKNNPYVHLLYVNDNDNPNTALHIQDPHQRSSSVPDALNREHCWPQSYGFKDDSGASGPAGTDLHHLMAGDAQVNSNGHNNYVYGKVTKNTDEWQEAINLRPKISGNKVGAATATYPEDLGKSTRIFEPQDSDKGDIARSIFYMCAKYNNYAQISDEITKYNPFLALSNYIYADGKSISSSDTTPATYGMVNVLLEWNKLDPPDSYEIYRNDLIYNNYQNNRNPFIDFPSWADYIWGGQTGYASPSTDPVNSFDPDEKILESITIEKLPEKRAYYVGDKISLVGAIVKAHYQDGSIEDVSNDVMVSPKTATQRGTWDCSILYTHNGITKSTTYSINVLDAPSPDNIVKLIPFITLGVVALISALFIPAAVKKGQGGGKHKK